MQASSFLLHKDFFFLLLRLEVDVSCCLSINQMELIIALQHYKHLVSCITKNFLDHKNTSCHHFPLHDVSVWRETPEPPLSIIHTSPNTPISQSRCPKIWGRKLCVWRLKVLDLTWGQNSMTKVIPNCSTPSKATPWKIASSLKNSRWRFHISDLPPNIYDPDRYSIMSCAAIFTVISNYCPCSSQTWGGVFSATLYQSR